jgi:Fe-S-cluster containining protein
MDDAPDMLPFQLTLRTGAEELHLQGAVPDAPLALVDLLPMLQELDNLVVAAAEREVEQRGRRISCGPGCGACCRQLVPISEAEAASLAKLVSAMPRKRREKVRRRFADALTTLERHGMIARIHELSTVSSIEVLRELGLAYFDLGIACPFLEDESCSIHPDRPLVCREYLVTSPPAECSTPAEDRVARVGIPSSVSSFLLTFGDGGEQRSVRWMPLVGTLHWAESNRGAPARFPSRFLVERLVYHLSAR